MQVFNIEHIIARLEEILQTQKGTMLDAPGYGFDWASLRRSLVTSDTLINFEAEARRAFGYLLEVGLCDELSVSTERLEEDGIKIQIKAYINGNEYSIESGTIDISSGEYAYAKFFEI